jgi:MtrB/PioB family decaheme-associated outer membrane protein
MKPTRATPCFLSALLVSTLLVLGVAGSAPAQTRVGGMNVEGSIEAGGQVFLTDGPKNKERGKFEEYRDIEAGPFLERLQLRFFTGDEAYTGEFGGSKWGREDQEFSLRAGRTGLWQFQFDWDQLPHLFSTTSRTLLHEVQRGVWAAPPITSLSDFNGQATSRELHDVSVRWDTARLFFSLTPTPDLDLNAQYTRTRKEGNRPFGMSFGSPGNNFLELLEPVEQTVHDFRLGGTFAREKYQLQFSYTLSVFQNDLSRVRFDNPCAQAPASAVRGGTAAQRAYGCSSTGTTATSGPGESPWPAGLPNPVPAAGQSSLPPDNMAHTFNIAGGVSLPLRTRITGNVTYSIALQNQDFLPHTINQSIAGNPDLALPQKSLNGNVQTLNLNFMATSRPFPLPLTLSAKYRLYDLHDLSDEIIFPGHVVSDRAQIVGTPAGAVVATCAGCTLGVAGPEQAKRQSFARHNADVDARYGIAQSVGVTIGAGWERWNRGPEREVQESDEYFAKAAIDATPFDWLMARLTYKPSFRRDSDYSRWQVAPSNGFLFRKIDEAERDRQRVDLLLQFTPLDTLSITPTASYRYDDYLRSAFGMLWETSWSAGIDLGWNPFERFWFSAGYVHELIDRDLKNRGAGGFDNTSSINSDWTTNMTDTIDTFYVAGKAALIPKVLDWTFGANYSTSSGTRETRLSSARLPGAVLAVPGLLPKRMPAYDDQIVRLDTALRYHFAKSWTASLFYTFEQFRKNDWRTDNWLPFNPMLAGTTGSIWLGNDAKNYDVHILGVTMAYKFE